MKTTITALIIASGFIFFWLYVFYIKVSHFAEFKREMAGQVFSGDLAATLTYVLPTIWLSIAALLAFNKTRLAGMIFNLALLLLFTVYVGMAVFKVYHHIPCDCAGLFNFNWHKQFYFNLIVTAVAATGFILTLILKYRERRAAVWTG